MLNFLLSIILSCNTYKAPNDSLTSCIVFRDSITKKAVYKEADVPAKYPGGEAAIAKFIQRNFQFENIDDIATIKVGFIIDVDGVLKYARILNKDNKKLSALERKLTKVVYKMPKWDVALCNSKRVPFYVWFPVRYY